MKCHRCGKSTKRVTVDHQVTVGGTRFLGKLPARACPACNDEPLVALDDLVAFEHAVAQSLARHGPVNGETLRSMRKSIPLSATALAALLRVAPETISRWETGEREVDRAAWLVVRGLTLDPDATRAIADVADTPPAKPVAIAVRDQGARRRHPNAPGAASNAVGGMSRRLLNS
jgi:DNA-binding transcriptional regulator YiaG